MISREYQVKAKKLIFEQFRTVNSTLLVMPTGTGKTRVAADVIKAFLPMRSMFVAHRGELLKQAQGQLAEHGITCEIEKAEQRIREDGIFGKCQVVCAMIQSLNSNDPYIGHKRMGKFNYQDFGLLILDECHHSLADSYVTLIRYMRQNPDLRVLGLTATPDRLDKKAMGRIFDTVAMKYEILDAIRDGYLVDIDQRRAYVKGLDYSHVKTTCGDLNGPELAKVLEVESNIQGMVQPTLECCYSLSNGRLAMLPPSQWRSVLTAKPRRTLVFTHSVVQAERLADIFNRAVPGIAGWVCGTTPEETRAKLIAGYDSGQFPIMVNCGIFTEGYDSPAIELVVMGRPTKSRALYSQMLGRGTRVLPGVIDRDDITTPEQRRTAIEASAKSRVVVLDFVGNSGKHHLINPEDILGGDYSEEVRARAIKIVDKSGGAICVTAALDKAAEELKREKDRRAAAESARKAKLVAKVKYSTESVNPFDVFCVEPVKVREWDSGRTLSPKQQAILLKQGIDPDRLPYAQGKQMLLEIFRRWDQGLCSFKQAQVLRKHGYETKNLTRKDASALLDQLKANGWRKPTTVKGKELTHA